MTAVVETYLSNDRYPTSCRVYRIIEPSVSSKEGCQDDIFNEAKLVDQVPDKGRNIRRITGTLRDLRSSMF